MVCACVCLFVFLCVCVCVCVCVRREGMRCVWGHKWEVGGRYI